MADDRESHDEVALPGGNVNMGVVRVGKTVRRTMTPAAPIASRRFAAGAIYSCRTLGSDPP